jgi:hypothetical protein
LVGRLLARANEVIDWPTDVCFWHKADIPASVSDDRFRA